jgi:type II secretory pathway component PulF
MPTATLQKNSTKVLATKKPKTTKVSASKEVSTLLVDEKKVKQSSAEVSSSKKESKVKLLEHIETSSISQGEKDIAKEKSSLLTSFFGKKNNAKEGQSEIKEEVQKEKKQEVKPEKSVATPATEKEKAGEKKAFLSSMFGKKKEKEEIKESVISKNPRNEKVTISEPVKATPVPQRKIADQKKLSTFGLSKERDQFIENLSMLVLSGMSIIGALSSIIKQTKSPGMKLILERMLVEIEAGSPVWKALDRTKFFKGYTISLIRLGEESGNFAENLKVVALEEEKDREFKSKVKSALMYPIFVLGLTGIVGIGISWFILPKLAKIFYDLKLALPLITRVLLAFGLFLNKHGLIAVPLGSAVIGGVGFVIFGWNKTKFLGEAIIFSIPGIKSLLMEVEVARFGYLLGTLLEAGLPVTKAIDSLAGASDVLRYKKFYLALRESIDSGNSFERSFAAYKNINALIPPPVQQLIISGEQSGNLNKTLIKVGQVLEAKSDTTTKNLTIIMEPILLVIVWAGVVSVAFAVILPIYSLVGGLNNIK